MTQVHERYISTEFSPSVETPSKNTEKNTTRTSNYMLRRGLAAAGMLVAGLGVNHVIQDSSEQNPQSIDEIISDYATAPAEADIVFTIPDVDGANVTEAAYAALPTELIDPQNEGVVDYTIQLSAKTQGIVHPGDTLGITYHDINSDGYVEPIVHPVADSNEQS